MDLCDVIFLNFLALLSVCSSMNAREEFSLHFGGIKENYKKHSNISRVKREEKFIYSCSDIMTNMIESGLPCFIKSKAGIEYDFYQKIADGGCGSVFRGKEQSMSMVSR
jgi:hypothetical protein